MTFTTRTFLVLNINFKDLVVYSTAFFNKTKQNSKQVCNLDPAATSRYARYKRNSYQMECKEELMC